MRLRDFGLTEGINEVIAVTIGDGINTAPIGIIVEDASSKHAMVRLYRSHTRENVRRGSRIFANIVRDPVVFALASFDDLDEGYFRSVNPPVLGSALAYCEFEAKLSGAFAELTLVDGNIFSKELRAVNRGFNAVIEALVHATRYVSFKEKRLKEELREKILYYKTIVEKCGSDREKEAFKILLERTGIADEG